MIQSNMASQLIDIHRTLQYLPLFPDYSAEFVFIRLSDLPDVIPTPRYSSVRNMFVWRAASSSCLSTRSPLTTLAGPAGPSSDTVALSLGSSIMFPILEPCKFSTQHRTYLLCPAVNQFATLSVKTCVEFLSFAHIEWLITVSISWFFPVQFLWAYAPFVLRNVFFQTFYRTFSQQIGKTKKIKYKGTFVLHSSSSTSTGTALCQSSRSQLH